MDGLIMDAEGGPDFFRGGVNEAHTYGNAMREVANNPKKLLGIFSNDIPQNLPGWLPKFNEIATKADFNFPQTYYGASASVASRVDKAENANAHLTIPFIPVGAGFIARPCLFGRFSTKRSAVRTTNNIKSARTARRRHRTLRP